MTEETQTQNPIKINIPLERGISPDYKVPGLRRPQEVKGDVPISPEPEKVGDDGVTSIDSFQKENDYPYVADYYKLDTPYEFIDQAMKEDLEEIDLFVKSRLGDGEKEMNLENYAEVLKEIEEEMGIDDSMLRNSAMLKIANLARNFNLALEAFNKKARGRILKKLLKMDGAGLSNFDQKAFVLERLGELI